MMDKRVLVHIVTWNNARTVRRCVESVCLQEGFALGGTLVIRVTDNSSSDETLTIVEALLQPGIELVSNRSNLGFSAGQNQGAERCLSGGFDYMLVLNPDVRLESSSLGTMINALAESERIGLVTPKLLRADDMLEPLSPRVLDAAGMTLNSSLRHLDRGSGDADEGQYDAGEDVFGGTGACLLLSAAFIREVVLPREVTSDSALYEIYPQLIPDAVNRPELFDEAFFAYREDADLAWRAQNLGWRCRYHPSAQAYHVRKVVPERRSELPPELNLYGVRNRFLLQLNNWRWSMGARAFLEGLCLRNVLVIAGVLVRERSSLPGLVHVARLFPRAMRIRRYLKGREAK